MAYEADEIGKMHAAIGAQKHADHAAGSFKVAGNSSDAGMGRGGGVNGPVSNQSNYNGPEAWTGRSGGPKLQDPRPAGNSSSPTFGKRG